MPRNQDTEKYELSDAEKRDLIKLLQQGKPLPEKYRFLLFEDPALRDEVELVWNGKTREVCNVILPFQTLEHIDEPRKELRDDEEFSFDTRGRQLKGWTNKLIWGDNKLILASLKSGALRVADRGAFARAVQAPTAQAARRALRRRSQTWSVERREWSGEGGRQNSILTG